MTIYIYIRKVINNYRTIFVKFLKNSFDVFDGETYIKRYRIKKKGF